MNQSVPLYAVLAVLAGGGVIYLIYRWVNALLNSAQLTGTGTPIWSLPL
jgi:hypothetical protein